MSEHAPKTDSVDERDNLGEIYFKIQSELDFTKHPGALDATDEIRDLCQIGPESLVLDVGCGVGMTATYLAKTIGCHVTGIDLREGMIARSNERAEREGVTDRVSFRVADATALPFEGDAFDVVMCESVLALVEDQSGVLAEMRRVLKPGGRLGVTEAAWMMPPTEELLNQLKSAFGHMEVHSPARWRELMEGAGFENVVVDAHEISVKSESLSRIRRYGLGHLLRAWGHMMKAMISEPQYRRLMKTAMQEPKELLRHWGYIVAVADKATGSRSSVEPSDELNAKGNQGIANAKMKTTGKTTKGGPVPMCFADSSLRFIIGRSPVSPFSSCLGWPSECG
jgi:ubiquinone/menaquinone biosynthesis C-methylase UbiE